MGNRNATAKKHISLLSIDHLALEIPIKTKSINNIFQIVCSTSTKNESIVSI